MSDRDRWWLSSLALAVVLVMRRPAHDALAEIVQLVWLVANTAGLVVLVLRQRRTKTEQQQPGQSPSRPVQLVQDQLEAFTLAGFTETQARELMQEAMRTAIRAQGGWQP